MKKSFKSIQLSSISPQKVTVSFDRDDLPKESEITINMSIKGELFDEAGESKNNCKLLCNAKAVGIGNDEKHTTVFNIELSVEYAFNIIDSELFFKENDDDRVSLCSAITFLDFRSRLVRALGSIGLGSLKIPLNAEQFADMK